MTSDSGLKQQLLNINGIMELDGQSQGNMPEWSDDYSSIWELLR